jgi:hypothetical protein
MPPRPRPSLGMPMRSMPICARAGMICTAWRAARWRPSRTI